MACHGILKRWFGFTVEKWVKVLVYVVLNITTYLIRRTVNLFSALLISDSVRWDSVPFEEEDISGKIIVLTGANRGIGKQLAILLAHRHATVIMACRNVEAGKKAIASIRNVTFSGKLIVKQLDVASQKSIRKFAQVLKEEYKQVDMLINNAGVLIPETKKLKTADHLEINFGLNYVGHFLLTQLLLDTLRKSPNAKIINVGSIAMKNQRLDFDNPMKLYWKPGDPSTVVVPYCNSKYALALFSHELAQRLKDANIRTYTVCPGIVATGISDELEVGILKHLSFLQNYIFLSANQGAVGILYCVSGRRCARESGQIYRRHNRWGKFVFPDDLMVRGTLPPITDELSTTLWKKTEEILDSTSSSKVSVFT